MTDELLDNQGPPLSRDADLVKLPRCKRCNLSYMPSKSTSSLRLTYCSFLCELGDLGFSMAGLEHMKRREKEEPEAVPALSAPVGAE
jgi:hypothetical protein